ncbi:MAG: hypothetical protein IIY36_03430 [Lachnospiraceae bacterium]|nr:hypothetical protein [Lachnospiraceae bacterium]
MRVFGRPADRAGFARRQRFCQNTRLRIQIRAVFILIVSRSGCGCITFFQVIRLIVFQIGLSGPNAFQVAFQSGQNFLFLIERRLIRSGLRQLRVRAL